MRAPCSSPCQLLFGRVIEDQPLDAILEVEREAKDALFFGFSQLFDNIMDPTVVVSMFPNRIHTTSGRHWHCTYAPVVDEAGSALALIISIKDVTERVEAEVAREAEIKRLRVVINILQQGPIFQNFLEDTNKDFADLAVCTDAVLGKRTLHTLKGNFGAMGLTEISTSIHEMENRLIKQYQQAEPAQLQTYFAACSSEIAHELDKFLQENEALLGIRRPAGAADSAAAKATGCGFAVFGEERVSALVKNFAPQIAKLAERLNKKIRFKLEGGDTLVDEERYGGVIREVIHLIRNSCDHGIEKTQERKARGKPEEGSITMSVTDSPESIELRVWDDGAGIKSERILEKALKSGLVSAEQASSLTPEDIFAFIFCDGVSSAEQVTSISGRGVGLSALKAEVERVGGVIAVSSRAGQGATFRITLPKAKLQAAVA